MKQKRTWVTLLLVLALLCLGIAYAVVSAVPLSISGSATAKADTLDVQFSNAVVDTTNTTATVTATPGSYTSGTAATLTVEDLQKAGEKAVVTYTVKNYSEDIAATLDSTCTIDNKNTTWYTVEATVNETTLAKAGTTGDTATITVTVTLNKTPATDADVTAANTNNTFTISFNANPVANS